MNLTFKTFTFVFWIIAVSHVCAADYSAPTEGDFTIRDFKFQSGETLPELHLHYRTIGKQEKDAQGKTMNAVLIMHGTTGSGAQFEKVRAKATKSGANYRMSAGDADLYAALEELRGAGAKIISVTQIKPTLEDFFMELVGRDRAQAAAIEVSGQ